MYILENSGPSLPNSERIKGTMIQKLAPVYVLFLIKQKEILNYAGILEA